MAVNWMVTGNYLIVHYGGAKPCSIEKSNEKYQKILSLLIEGAPEKKIVDELDCGKAIEEYTERSFQIDSGTGEVTIDGETVKGVIVERIVEFYKKNLPYLPLVNFWKNIQANPSEESKEHLFMFLEANKMPITHDGCFLAYKNVKKTQQGDLVDMYSGSFCNNVGAVITMDRDRVNPDRHTTCSHGLHVASFDYAKDFWIHHDIDRVLLEVKVNPSDVVAVPSDYSNQKMRVCRYEVVGINKYYHPVEKEYIDKTEVRAKRKLGEKSIKESKKSAQKKKNEQHLAMIDSIKNTLKGDIVLLSGLTAHEIVEVIQALTGKNIMEGLKDLKNKKGIVKRAQNALIENGFKVDI